MKGREIVAVLMAVLLVLAAERGLDIAFERTIDFVERTRKRTRQRSQRKITPFDEPSMTPSGPCIEHMSYPAAEFARCDKAYDCAVAEITPDGASSYSGCSSSSTTSSGGIG